MLIDAIKHQKDNKTLWIVVIVFVNTLGAIIYYFVEKKPRDKIENQNQTPQTSESSIQNSEDIPTPSTLQRPS